MMLAKSDMIVLPVNRVRRLHLSDYDRRHQNFKNKKVGNEWGDILTKEMQVDAIEKKLNLYKRVIKPKYFYDIEGEMKSRYSLLSGRTIPGDIITYLKKNLDHIDEAQDALDFSVDRFIHRLKSYTPDEYIRERDIRVMKMMLQHEGVILK